MNDIERIRELEKKRTPGEWKVGYDDGSGSYREEYDTFCISTEKDDRFVFHGKLSENKYDCEYVVEASKAVPMLLEKLDRCEKALEFYAHPATYENGPQGSSRLITSDRGKKAGLCLNEVFGEKQ